MKDGEEERRICGDSGPMAEGWLSGEGLTCIAPASESRGNAVNTCNTI